VSGLDDHLQYVPGFLPDPGATLAAVREQVAWTTQMASRRTASEGVPYNYSGASYPVAAWSPAVAAVRDRVAAALGFEPTNCLMNRYADGRQSLGFHSDDVAILEADTPIVIVSLGATRTLRLRTTGPDGFVYVDRPLVAGSMLVMDQAMQASWRHAIRREPIDDERISLTFRRIVRWNDDGTPWTRKDGWRQ
jgi:alkylated DNA repair dioxygenase AlkB